MTDPQKHTLRERDNVWRGGSSRWWTVLFAVFAGTWVAFFFLVPTAVRKAGVVHYHAIEPSGEVRELWFLDTYAVLAASDAARLGKDPYQPNPFDYLGRPHVYGPSWLQLHHTGLKREHVFAVGLAVVIAFVLAAVVCLRPRTPAELAWCILIFCTTPVLFGIERGNNDLVVFILLLPVVPCLSSRHMALRWLAVPLIALAFELKYYPAVAAVVLLAHGSTRELRWRIGLTIGAFGFAAWHIASAVPDVTGRVPSPEGVFIFGATNVFRMLQIGDYKAQTVIGLIAVWAVVRWWRSPIFKDWRQTAGDRAAWLYFVLGAALLVGCFFLGRSFPYRWIFAIWLAPFLWRLAWDAAAPHAVRNLGRATAGLLLLMMWAEPLAIILTGRPERGEVVHWLYWLALAIQPFTWAFILLLMGFLVAFARDALSQVLGRPREAAIAS